MMILDIGSAETFKKHFNVKQYSIYCLEAIWQLETEKT